MAQLKIRIVSKNGNGPRRWSSLDEPRASAIMPRVIEIMLVGILLRWRARFNPRRIIAIPSQPVPAGTPETSSMAPNKMNKAPHAANS